MLTVMPGNLTARRSPIGSVERRGHEPNEETAMKAKDMQEGRIYKFRGDGDEHTWLELVAIEIDDDGDVLASGYWGDATARLAYGTGAFEASDVVHEVSAEDARKVSVAKRVGRTVPAQHGTSTREAN